MKRTEMSRIASSNHGDSVLVDEIAIDLESKDSLSYN